MQITSRFTIAVHLIACTAYLKDTQPVTSKLLAGSIGANPVIIRGVMGKLKDAGIISISQGKSGITLAKALSDITFLDIYNAVDCVNTEGLFHFHEHPSMDCPVGRNIHRATDEKLRTIQEAMETQMQTITMADVTDDIRKEIALAN